MAHPLELSYNWRPPVSIATIGLVVSIGVLGNGRPNGWIAVAVVLAAMWLLFLAVVWVRTRAYMMFEGPILRVRRMRHFHQLDGRKVTRVREFHTANGPSYRIWLEGDERRYVVPAALLKKGHSTLFEWLLTWAPKADLDKGARKTIDNLRTRGMIE